MIRIIILALILTGCAEFGCDNVSFEGIDGKILLGSDKCEMSDSNISLNSKGGYVEPAIKISNRVKLNDTDTVVNGICESACVLIAASGNNRYICQGSRLGIHSATDRKATLRTIEFYQSDSRINGEFMESALLNTPNDTMLKLPDWRAVEVGLIDEIIRCN